MCLYDQYHRWKTAQLTNKSTNNTDFLLCNYPYLLSADAKRRILLADTQIIQQQAQNHAVAQGLFSGTGIIFPWFVIGVERAHLLQQALIHIANASNFDLKKPLKVVFQGEEGVDEGI